MLASISIQNAATLLLAADTHNVRVGMEGAQTTSTRNAMKSWSPIPALIRASLKQYKQAVGLRAKVVSFILQHFDAVSKTRSFEDMAHANVDLVVEVLRKR